MILVLGVTLGLGLLLVVSPVVWPAGRGREARPEGRMSAGLRERLAQAGLHSVSITALVLVSVIAALVVAALCFVLVPVAAIALIAGLVALALPAMAVTWRARARRRATRVLWPDVVDHLVSAVRSGLALPDSLVTLAHSGPVATRDAFAAFEREYRATGNFGLCVDDLKRRLADPVADRILETLRMSREVGGSELTTVLRGLAAYLRQEAAIRAEVEARQSWVLNAAKLGVAAPWVILLLLATRPEAARAYNSPGGVTIIVAGLVVTVIAYRVMLGLGRIPEERRWFS
ncbi:type II secretion system F family protein [Lacisediminihabitans changchengi]|uniref:Type II secretion system F family protein n=1 Tax=Lacisediminihabitans changchengi TaxID=2787634 RepID=A0A934SIQ9_9MICO|nr:type II secretion system F family protein [Lacisediminihabitans changchengi]MBK4347406.1 type II secretion system F family protein [Lacisediminihabitans changchengi]